MMKPKAAPWTRRKFLAALGLSAATPTILPPSVFGLDGTVAPSNRIVMATLGVGNRAQDILAHFMGNREIHMRAVCDCRADRLQRGKEKVDGFYKNQDCQTHRDFRELLARPDIDAVFIATGVRWHGVASLYAAQAGKDIYSEKPVTLSIAEGRALVETCKRLGTIYQAGHQRRSVDSYKFMAEVARRGLIGKVHTVLMQVWEGPAIPNQPCTAVPEGFDYEMWLGQSPWRPFNWAHVNGFMFFWDFSDGVLTEMGCHYTDLMQFGLETDTTGPIEFEGTAEFPDPKTAYSETPLRGEVRCRYANGVTGIMRQTGKFEDRFIRFIGDRGWIQVDDQTDVVTAEPKSLLGLRRDMGDKGWADTSGHIGDLVRGIKTRTATICHPETAHRANSIGQLMNLCLRLGRKLQWNPAAEKFIKDEEANRMLARAIRPPWHL
jgi:predicted dehydrogenase